VVIYRGIFKIKEKEVKKIENKNFKKRIVALMILSLILISNLSVLEKIIPQ